MTTRGFVGRGRTPSAEQLPPGQYVTRDFPVLSAGPTPRTRLEQWSFAICYKDQVLIEWNWQDLSRLPHTKMNVDIHCVTKWSKLDTHWTGISIDTLFEAGGIDPPADYVMAFCDGDYTTNHSLEDMVDGRAMIALSFDGEPLPAAHGGPARLFVPHLYFWKSAKWIRGFRFMDSNEPGFWEASGYHLRGDPWQEQRYSGD